MKSTDNIYLTDNRGIYVEFFGKEGSHQYIHIDCNGLCEFKKEINEASLNTYWIDHVSHKVIQTHGEILLWAKNLFENSDLDVPGVVEEETAPVDESNFTADDIPF